ncbi:acyl-CoA dehydrogenase family protein [Micromonospora craniellae]|uniref:Acyl-CoA dehydrogenase n=1 Tax=Micromonospora craniellae TaxID=2294034 RepID=A0A372FUT8_9ACTN|nr:acyl-CoA dehydrogenase family protein [Micromonospora craniellae]QOC89749.1 acyl-CoA dehydrogenase family protein [Micromonospora craniellae]RFS44531.1 acyl-CoA dehydrogenase [Micromonospora craniellae]
MNVTTTSPGLLDTALATAEPFRPDRVAELDRTESFPTDAVRLLDELGVPDWYVPARLGGALTDHTQLVEVVRTIARHDLTAAIAHAKTYLGAVCVWVAGDQEKAERLGARIRAGAVVSWALTERGHGSDLVAGELTATECPGGYRLDGEKWPINNATRAGTICVLARTSAETGARGHSLFLVDKDRLAPGSYRTLPKARTHGIRGADISGIAFDGAVVPAEALVGRPGAGLEIVLKALQLTRVMAAGLSLGAVDHARELTLRYVRERKLYGRRLIELPHVRRSFGEVSAAALVAESVVLFAGRAAGALTGEMSVYSAVAKALAPTLVDEAIARCGELLGARAFLTTVYADGAFQKLERDHRIVGIFDGSTFVNRHSLITQFPLLAAGWRQRVRDVAGLRAVEGGPPTDPGRLALFSRAGCSLVQSLPFLVEQVRTSAPESVLRLAAHVLDSAERLHDEMAALRPQGVTAGVEAFDLARRYEWCLAAAAVLHRWSAEPARPKLAATLALIVGRLGGHRPDPAAFDRLTDDLKELS